MRYRAIYLGREKVMGFSADVPLSAFARAVLPSGRFVRSYASAWTGGAAMAWAFGLLSTAKLWDGGNLERDA
jgi:hypothetical protein